MYLSIGSNNSGVQNNIDTAHGLKTAKIAQSQQEIEAQMALKLIESANVASIATSQVSEPTATSGQTINIKV